MVFGIVTSLRSALLPMQALELAKIYLENASKANDAKITLVLCHDTENSLSQARRASKNAKDNTMFDGIAAVYVDLGNLLYTRGYHDEAKTSFMKAQKLG